MNVLFLCTGNSCRSQMAEAWARELTNKLDNAADWQIQSAGLEAHGLNSGAVKAMSKHGVDISRQTSDVLSPQMLDQADILITVCGHADEHCPLLPPNKKKIHLPFTDPAKATGTDAEIEACFDDVCLQIRDGINQLFKELVQ